MSRADEFVMVPVPRERVLEVYALLAEGISPSDTPASGVSPATEWDRSIVNRVMELLSERGQRLALVVAEGRGEWLATDHLIDALSLEPGQRAYSQLQGLVGSVKKNQNWVSSGLSDLVESSGGPQPSLRMAPALANIVLERQWKPR